MVSQRNLIELGCTAWRTAHAERIGFIIDARDYFAAFVDAISHARESVLILAWDIDSRLRLIRDRDSETEQHGFANLLTEVLGRRPDLHINILCWDFSTIYATERELLSQLKMGWGGHERLHFRYDDRHPPMASHHEKIVVIDDRVAFIGGIDLGPRRWDTSHHLPDDERRVSPQGLRYRPFHDVHAVVQGEVARALGDHARDRWHRASGDRLAPPRCTTHPWPADVEIAIEDLEVAIVKTRPEHEGRPALRNTLRFHERLFERAQRHIFVENQFLTSDAICDALVAALESEEPPETLLVTARENSGWLEKTVMGGLRTAFCRHLQEADRFGRLRVFYPEITDGVWPNVHSKLAIVDDRWAYIGSANLASRSMGFDTECGLGLDGTGRDDVRSALRALRFRLLAEHLDVEPDDVSSKEEQIGMLGAVDSLRGNRRTLKALETAGQGLGGMLEPVARLADPEQPIRLAELVDDFF